MHDQVEGPHLFPPEVVAFAVERDRAGDACDDDLLVPRELEDVKDLGGRSLGAENRGLQNKEDENKDGPPQVCSENHP